MSANKMRSDLAIGEILNYEVEMVRAERPLEVPAFEQLVSIRREAIDTSHRHVIG